MIATDLNTRAVSPAAARRAKGFALITVMWVVLVAGLMLLGVQKSVRANLAMAHNELESVRAHWLARAGVAQALAVLEDDDAGSDGAWDAWYSNEESFRQVELSTGVFHVVAPPPVDGDPAGARYGLVDHCARLNVNTADQKQLKSICDLTDEQVGSILDWRDADNNTRNSGAEATWYRRLDHPYQIRNGPLMTIGELHLIRGIDRDIFAAEDANLNGILDANEDDLERSQPYDDGDGRLKAGLGGLTTVYSYERNRDAYGNERVNVNTAGQEKLVEQFNFSDELAKAVVATKAAKNTSPKPGKSKSNKFNSLMDLLNVKAGKAAKKKGSEDKLKKITVKWLAEHLDELTLTDDQRLDGRINVNTAPKEVLMTLDKMKSVTADKIIARQSSGDGPFDSVGELLTSETISEDQFKAFAERLTVRSSVFEIRSTGITRHGIRRQIVAVVDRGAERASVLYWYQSE